MARALTEVTQRFRTVRRLRHDSEVAAAAIGLLMGGWTEITVGVKGSSAVTSGKNNETFDLLITLEADK